jgi:hypothetical protein
MHALIATLQHNPEIALILSLPIGFWFGSLKFSSFSRDRNYRQSVIRRPVRRNTGE